MKNLIFGLIIVCVACKTTGKVSETAAFTFNSSTITEPKQDIKRRNTTLEKEKSISNARVSSSNSEVSDKNNDAKKHISEKLGIPIPEEVNAALIEEIVKWLHAPYKWGGTTIQGTDCSGFVYGVFKKVYGTKPPRTSRAQYAWCRRVSSNKKEEGDLVFFKIGSSRVSHVGIYLFNQYFVHASTRKGVIVSSLNEKYYKRYFFAVGRPPVEK